MRKIKLLINYIVYTLRRKGAKGHGIHSSFVFKFNRDVLNNTYQYEKYQLLKDFRSSLAKNNNKITVYDLGAGSNVFASEKRIVSEILKVSASSSKTGRLLFRLANFIKPQTTVELGTSLGYGTVCLAAGSSEGIVYSLEACPRQLKVAEDELNIAGISNVELINGDFRTKLPELLNNLSTVDLVYFDGDHRKESLLWQYNQCVGKAGKNTIFVVGDIHWSDEMQKGWKILCKDPGVSISVDLYYCGLLFFRDGMVKQHYILSYSD